MSENDDGYLAVILKAGQSVESSANELFGDCHICDRIFGYLKPQEKETERTRTISEINAVLGEDCEQVIERLVSAKFMDETGRNSYRLSTKGILFAEYASPVPSGLNIGSYCR